MTSTDGHLWLTRSRHRTSGGTMSYQSCHCGLWRILAPRTVEGAGIESRAGEVVADRIGAGCGQRP